MILTNLNLEISLLVLLWEKLEISQATIGSIYFPAIHYFALFIGRCINGKHDHSHMCVPDLCVLKSALLGYKGYNFGAIVARRLQNNSRKGNLFGGIVHSSQEIDD